MAYFFSKFTVDIARSEFNCHRYRGRQLLKTNHKNNSLIENLQAPSFLAKSLSDENRLRILLCISNRKKSVSAIVEELQLSQPLISHHLKELKRSLLVTVERDGPFIYYEVADKRIIDILKKLNLLAIDLLERRITF
jgi:DNA-binding transcriptional ArsR family regulator